MTLHATREGKMVTVHTTYGPVTNAITEEAGHVAHFHAQLGSLLGDDKLNVKTPEQRAREGHARFAASVDATGEVSPQPAFDEQPEEIRNHWIAAFTE
jgi:hypothetical protein